jgi:drug/metabolite transporter (DMT)-like permease
MVLLTGRMPSNLAIGDLLTLVCAVWLGLHTALLSRHAPHHDPRALATAQMLAMAALFLLLWPLAGTLEAPPREVWFAIVVTGLVASALAFAVQSAAQQRLSTAHAAILLTTEPLFAGLFGYLLAGDRLGAVQIFGAALILGAVGLAELVPAAARR